MKNMSDNPFKIVIIGRAGTGKDAMKRTLMEAIPGVRPLKTHTDRPKRFPQEDSYIFHTKQGAAMIPRRDKLLYTKLSDGERFTTKKDLEEANLMILDPSGFYEACRRFPQDPFLVIHMTADEETAREHALLRYQDPEKGGKIWLSRRSQENAAQCEFEDNKKHAREMDFYTDRWPGNARNLLEVPNNFEPGALCLAAEFVSERIAEYAALLPLSRAIVKSRAGNPDAAMESTGIGDHYYTMGPTSAPLLTQRIQTDTEVLKDVILELCRLGALSLDV